MGSTLLPNSRKYSSNTFDTADATYLRYTFHDTCSIQQTQRTFDISSMAHVRYSRRDQHLRELVLPEHDAEGEGMMTSVLLNLQRGPRMSATPHHESLNADSLGRWRFNDGRRPEWWRVDWQALPNVRSRAASKTKSDRDKIQVSISVFHHCNLRSMSSFCWVGQLSRW